MKVFYKYRLGWVAYKLGKIWIVRFALHGNRSKRVEQINLDRIIFYAAHLLMGLMDMEARDILL